MTFTTTFMTNLRMPDVVYAKDGPSVFFNQLALKIEMDAVSNEEYFAWLDRMIIKVAELVPGANIAEKVDARIAPPLNIAVYYDTGDYRILPTGALLRTSCNRITHAFCAFKMAQNANGVRNDHRYVFDGDEKSTIQRAPTSDSAVAIVKRLLSRRDIEHPGTYLERHLGIRGEELDPAICLEDYRFTFYVWLDKKDALRCSIDRFEVSDLRKLPSERIKKPVSEVEIAVYPRIEAEVAKDPRVLRLIQVLSKSLCQEFNVAITTQIKYQRSARVLGLYRDRVDSY